MGAENLIHLLYFLCALLSYSYNSGYSVSCGCGTKHSCTGAALQFAMHVRHVVIMYLTNYSLLIHYLLLSEFCIYLMHKYVENFNFKMEGKDNIFLLINNLCLQFVLTVCLHNLS